MFETNDARTVKETNSPWMAKERLEKQLKETMRKEAALDRMRELRKTADAIEMSKLSDPFNNCSSSATKQELDLVEVGLCLREFYDGAQLIKTKTSNYFSNFI
jgi:hypothetical protein